MVLGMGAYDASSYGGCQDLTCFDPVITVSNRLLALNQEVYGEISREAAQIKPGTTRPSPDN